MTIDTNCKTFLHTQEEFDQKLGAEYESYGLHFSKVSIVLQQRNSSLCLSMLYINLCFD